MPEKFEQTPDKPRNDIPSALTFLLSDGEGHFWDEGNLEVAESLYQVASKLDSDDVQKLRELVDWVDTDLPVSIGEVIEAVEREGTEASKSRYIHSLEEIIRGIRTPSLLGRNALRLAANISKEEYVTALDDAVREADTLIASKVANDEEGMAWLLLAHESQRFSEYARKSQDKGLNVFREFINTLNIDLESLKDEKEPEIDTPDLLSQVEDETDKLPVNFTPALLCILGKRGGLDKNFNGYDTALLLYKYLQDPGSDRRSDKLLSAVVNAEDEVFNSVNGAMEDIEEKEATQADFLSSLADVMKAIHSSDLPGVIDAVRLARQLKAWDLAESVSFVQRYIEENRASIQDDEQSDYELLKKEINSFFDLRHAFSPSSETIVSPTETVSKEDARLTIFRDFVNSLDDSDKTS